MLKTIELMRGQAYERDGVRFEKGTPRCVDILLAEALLETGSFREVDNLEALEDFLDGIEERDALPSTYVVTPANTIGNDDLNGKRVLIRRTGGIGDLVFAAIVIQYLKERYPESHIAFAVAPEMLPFCQMFSAPDQVMLYSDSTKVEIMHSYHYVISFNGCLSTEASAGRDNVDYFQSHWERAGIVGSVPEKFRTLDMGRLIANLVVNTTATDILKAEGKLGEAPYVVLLLGTSNALKRMHLSTINDIATRLQDPTNLRQENERFRVICLGGKDDRVIQSPSPWVSVHSDLPLPVCAELIRRSHCVIGADTGLMQLAAAMAVPVVTVWGPTRPNFSFAHYPGPQTNFTAEGKLACAPCMQLRISHCKHYNSGYTECMKLNSGEAIAAAVQATYKENPTHALREMTSADVVDRVNRSGKLRIAVLLDNADAYTGGGCYTWNIAKALAARPMVHVTVITSTSPDKFVYTQQEILPIEDRFKIAYSYSDLSTWDTNNEYDIVIGNPPFTGAPAVAYAKRTGAKSVLFVYETPNYIKQYREGLDGEEKYWEGYKAALLEANHVWCISKDVKKALFEWLPYLANSRSQSTWVVPPTFNADVADSVMEKDSIYYGHKEDRVVLIARNVKYKNLRETIHAIAENLPGKIGRRITLSVIGDRVKRLSKMVLGNWNADVEFLENVTERDKWQILRKAKVLVHSSDFEGFGIPPAEALYAGAQVIAHPLPVFKRHYGNQINYYTDEESLLDQLGKSFADWDTIKDMEEDVDTVNAEHVIAAVRKRRVAAVYGKTATNALLSRVLKADVEAVAARAAGNTGNSLAPVKVAIVGPWNTQCGIAETTREFAIRIKASYRVFSYTDIPPIRKDGAEVVRCWDREFNDTHTLRQLILEYGANIVHFQHEHSLFQNQANFFQLITQLRADGLKVVVTLHTYLTSKFVDDLLTICDAVVVTKQQEGMNGQTFLDIPLPVEGIEPPSREEARRALDLSTTDLVVGTFGMWQEHKGFREFLATLNDVSLRTGHPTTYLISGAAPKKSQYLMEARRQYAPLIETGRVRMFNDYPPISDVITRLAACDILVFNYSVPQYISASAAIRTGMQSRAAIICSTSPMFCEFEDGKHVLKTQFGNAEELISAIVRLHKDPVLRRELSDNCLEYCKSCTPSKIADKHEELYTSLLYGNGDEEEELTADGAGEEE